MPAGGPGRARRPKGALGVDAVRSSLRLTADAAAIANEAAEALGVTRDLFIEQLLLRLRTAGELDENGRPVWWDMPVPGDQGELPLKSA